MKLRRIVFGTCLVGYSLQVATAIYFAAWPVANRALSESAVMATLKKDVNPYNFMPLIGFALLVRPENYHVVLSNGYDEKAFGIDVKEDLPLDDLKAINEGTEIIIVRQSTGREITRLASSNIER